MIRDAVPADAARIAALYNYYVENTCISFEMVPVTADIITARMEQIKALDLPYLVWEEDGQVAGWCYAHLWKGFAGYTKTMETTIYLEPGIKHRGIGTQLMQELIRLCRERGIRVLIACITADNLDSRAFHESLGFKQASYFHQVGEKLGRLLDVADYELLLTP